MVEAVREFVQALPVEAVVRLAKIVVAAGLC